DRQINEGELKPQIPRNGRLPRGASGVIQLTVPNNLSADRYQGTIVVPVENSDTPVTSTITLDVKHGPWIAVAVLLIGILLGRVVQAMNTQQAQAQQRLLTSLATLQSGESDVKDAGFLTVLDQRVNEARDEIRLMVKSEGEISQDLITISTAI